MSAPRLVLACAAFGLALSAATPSAHAAELERRFKSFTVKVDCGRKVGYWFEYQTVPDTGKLERTGDLARFNVDPLKAAKNCQQTNTKPYGTANGVDYDMGHLIPINHFDHDRTAALESNYMTNITPQARKLNRGAWLRTEELIECHRDDGDLFVEGGVVWNDAKKTHKPIASHGVQPPEYYWKLVSNTRGAVAWLFPNSNTGVEKADLDKYKLSVKKLEEFLGVSFPSIPAAWKLKPAPASFLPYDSRCSGRQS